MGDCFIGFDGFADEIIRAVDHRSTHSFIPIRSLAAFKERIIPGTSCNIELVVEQTKIGGNGPILANALSLLGHPVTLAGTLGFPSIDPLFDPLVIRCKEVFSYENPGHTEALEFSDGKIILGKMGPLLTMTAEKIIEAIGKERLADILDKSSLFVSANWTMLPMMNSLWRALLQLKLSPKKRYLFVDFADPKKRSDDDLKEALTLLQQFNKTFQVILSLNETEASRIASLLGTSPQAEMLLEHSGLSQTIIHSPKMAFAAKKNEVRALPTFYTPEPKLTTGAGDNFNAGFCHGLLQDLPLKNCLQIGNGCAGYYVREGRSPNAEELAIFMQGCDNM